MDREDASGAVVVDVRDDVQRGEEPFARIMAAVESLGPEQALVLVNWFEPLPLYRVMQRKGFHYASEELPDGCWQVTFRRAGAATGSGGGR